MLLSITNYRKALFSYKIYENLDDTQKNAQTLIE